MYRGLTAILLICFSLFVLSLGAAHAEEDANNALFFSNISPSAGMAIDSSDVAAEQTGFHAFRADHDSPRFSFFSGKSWDAGMSSGPPKYERSHRAHHGVSNQGSAGATPFVSLRYRFE